ncbi:MAG: hypothetical protein GC159_14240 [Phycisphaera sp.]|nr:hypothetical protein [Phycisphaera sp.]
MNDASETLVFHHGALGDCVLTWPLLRGMGAAGGATLIAPSGKAKLSERHLPGVTGMDGDAPDWSRLFAPEARHEISDRHRAILAGAKRIVSFISSGRDAWADNIWTIAPKADVAFVQARPPEGFSLPIGVFYEHQLTANDIRVTPMMPERRRNPDGPVVVHPGSGGADKCWPTDRFERLVDSMETIGRPVVMVVGEVEQERIDDGTLARWRDRYDLREPETAVELGEIIAQASVFVGNDSGPAHLAAQLGVATVALFGPTDPRVWAPVGPAAAVIWAGSPTSMDWLEVERVAGAVARW